MSSSAQTIAYQQTGFFTEIVNGYLQGDARLEPFFRYTPDWQGLEKALKERENFPVDRLLLTEVLRMQYEKCMPVAAVLNNIERLTMTNTFTVTTAHQPNLFTGPLYFIYKCLHTIQLANQLQHRFPANNFVPVYYIGSEDADLEEIGQLNVGGIKMAWNTRQTGAVGRMKVDQPLLDIIASIEGQTGVEKWGKELTELWRRCFVKGKTIADATRELLHSLMGQYGLVVLDADHPRCKQAFVPILSKELATQFSHEAVADSISQLSRFFKVQAAGREINLFYLINDRRERLEKEGNDFTVPALQLRFTREEMETELITHPDRFSPNVILRGVLQESLLPNIAFIGGGGELAYWLELLPVFQAAGSFFPVLLLRNSFLLMTDQQASKWQQTGFGISDLFTKTESLLSLLAKREAKIPLQVEDEKKRLLAVYDDIRNKAAAVDSTLLPHVEALEKSALEKLDALEKKMLRAEKRKHAESFYRIQLIKDQLFPGGGLQERTDNMALWYAHFGKQWIQLILDHSEPITQGFTVLTCREN
ncbi:MAG: bacillithiol biosynthesis cysteine-adding enzyme BshC [Sediminibacterium sp.]